MSEELQGFSARVNRRHVVAGVLGAAALPLAAPAFGRGLESPATAAPDRLKGTTLYSSGESCPMCMGAIVWCGISRVVFGASIAQLATKIGQIMVTDAEIAAKTPFTDIALTGGVLAKESLALFK